jgi:hypothetical protein
MDDREKEQQRRSEIKGGSDDEKIRTAFLLEIDSVTQEVGF